MTFNANLLTDSLSVEHRNFGLYLVEDEDFLYLMLRGETLPKNIFAHGATYEEIRRAADQVVFWAQAHEAGIIFERMG